MKPDAVILKKNFYMVKLVYNPKGVIKHKEINNKRQSYIKYFNSLVKTLLSKSKKYIKGNHYTETIIQISIVRAMAMIISSQSTSNNILNF